MIPENIVIVAKRMGLKGIAITDHNTIKGGLQARKRNKADDFLVIVGSEIITETCEIIGLFLNEEISSTDPYVVTDAIRDQGGIIVLPHPFRSFLIPSQKKEKSISPEILRRVDVVEAFNSRTDRRANQQAQLLALKMKKPIVAGSDAHFYKELGKTKTCVVCCDTEEDVRKSLQKGRTQIETSNYAFITAMPFILLSGIYGRGRKMFSNTSFYHS